MKWICATPEDHYRDVDIARAESRADTLAEVLRVVDEEANNLPLGGDEYHNGVRKGWDRACKRLYSRIEALNEKNEVKQ